MSGLWVYRVLTWSVLVAGLIFAAMVLGLRHWALPNIGQYREEIARIVSQAAHQKIEIGYIRGNWDGLRPQLVLEQVRVLDGEGQPVLELSRVDSTVSWFSLITLQPRFYALDIHRPTLEIRRDASGAIFVAGIKLSSDSTFANWLLRQRHIEIIDATVAWTDEQMAAPRVEFKHARLHIINRGSRHLFGLQALPPRELAAPLDLRGDLRGDSVEALAEWKGRLFLQLDYADIAAWRQWIPFPVEFPRGKGAVRAWINVSERTVTDATVDLHLADVHTRLAPDLPELDLTELSGRLRWKSSRAGFEFTTAKLGLKTTRGLALPPADFRLRVVSGADGGTARGELRVDALELDPLAALADRLPLGEEARDAIARFAPQGGLRDLALRWRGDWRKPAEYSVAGRFEKLALGHSDAIPGFRGLSGSVNASERGGTLTLNSQKAAIEMPSMFPDTIEFDVLTAQLRWERRAEEAEIRINSVSFSNSHLAGTLFGTLRKADATRGHIDLTGNLARADLRHVGRYVPLTVGADEREWLNYAFRAGEVTKGSLRLKGDLAAFPFSDGRDGVFQVTARVRGGVLQYAKGWPVIDNITADVMFRGEAMTIYGRRASVFGTRLSKVRATIPDLTAKEEMLSITGEAEGPTGEFLTFMEKSPVLETIDGFTEGWKAHGPGRLALSLNIPMRAKHKIKVAGSFQFDGNTVTTHPALPVVEQATGRVEFTNSSVRARGITALALGGPVTITADTGDEGTAIITAQGQMNTDNLQNPHLQPAWLEHVRGATDWRAVITTRKRASAIVVESNLRGMAVYLPPPLLKPPREALPLRFERRVIDAGEDRIDITVGDVIGIRLDRQTDGANIAISRGVVRFGGAAGEPDRAGVWLSGNTGTLDLDRWLALLRQPGESTRVDWGGIDLKLKAMDALGRRYHDLSIHAVADADGTWRSSLVGKEFEGTLLWQPQGRGRLTARMKTLSIPAPSPATLRAPPVHGDGKERRAPELPALDITAERFSLQDTMLGSLEVAAVPEGLDWRIERLSISNPESTFTLQGLWEGWLVRPRMRVNVRLDAKDAGKLLDRLGHSGELKQGAAVIEGALSWEGSPYEIDYPSLSGNLVLDAQKGQFGKINAGVGKLLGVVSLQALPRRISLDFRDVFSEGFAFDEIVGPLKIERGIAVTENFRIQGPSARVVMKGKVDLARETQDLRVRVTPFLSESVSIAGALIGGPVAGVATLFAQKMLKDPIDNMAAFEYDVTGTWKEPQVTKVQRQPEVDDASGPES